MMEKLTSEYPTEAQMKEMWEALEEGNDQAILAVFHKRQEDVRAAKNTTDNPESD
jgi:hypothetical protein